MGEVSYELDEYQSAVVNDTYKPNKAVLVQACAGSGKTLTILCKAISLNKHIQPDKIVSLAFGNKAARELKQRYRSMKDKGQKSIVCSTIHSFSNSILKDFFGKRYTVMTEWKSHIMLRDIIEKKLPDATTRELNKLAKELYENYNKTRITELEEDAESSYFKPSEVESILEELEDTKEETKCMDYCDMLFKTYKELLFNPEKLEQIQNHFKVYLIDEAQDLDNLQHVLISMLAKKCYTVYVGDTMQTLYKFRFAQPLYFTESHLSVTFSEVVTYPLLKNYRSTKNIVNIGNTVRVAAKNPYKAVPFRQSVKGSVSMTIVRNNIQEGTKIAREIQNLLSEGVEPKNIAVLSRSNGYIKSIIEPAFVRENIKYKLMSRRQGKKLTEKSTTQAVFNLISYICNDKDSYSLFELAKYINGIGDATAVKLHKAYKESKTHPDLTKAMLQKYNTVLHLQKEVLSLRVHRVIEESSVFVDEMLSLCRAHLNEGGLWDNEREVLNIRSSLKYWMDFYVEEGVVNLTDILEKIINEIQDFDSAEDETSIQIHTVHSSKGLEWDYTFASGFNSAIKQSDDLHDEAFILYVQLSRAKEKLFVVDSYSYRTLDGRNITPHKNKTFSRTIKLLQG